MRIPDLIEIIPVDKPVRAVVTVPGSKSITNRALILAALAPGETVLRGALWSEDTQVMVDCLQELGFMLNVETDPDEPSNRTITVYGKGGAVPRGGTESCPLELIVGNAGTAARFLTALVCLGQGTYRLHGEARMHQRPQQALFQALRQLGYRVDSPTERLPAVIHGAGPRPGRCRVSIEESSQFASALLLSGGVGGWSVEVHGENAEESPYVKMTSEMLAKFAQTPGTFQIEADASSGSYFIAAGLFLPPPTPADDGGLLPTGPAGAESSVTVLRWPRSGWQIDESFPVVLRRDSAFWSGLRAAQTSIVPGPVSHASRGAAAGSSISRMRDLGDSILTAIVLAPFAAEPVRFTDLGRLRLQECERVLALHTELVRCGAKVIEEGDTLTVYPSELHGATVQTYNDHRLAMCFATLGLKVPGMRIQNPACVKKTFPDFYQKLATPPPVGLGAIIRDPVTGRDLGVEDLFAD